MNKDVRIKELENLVDKLTAELKALNERTQLLLEGREQLRLEGYDLKLEANEPLKLEELKLKLEEVNLTITSDKDVLDLITDLKTIPDIYSKTPETILKELRSEKRM